MRLNWCAESCGKGEIYLETMWAGGVAKDLLKAGHQVVHHLGNKQRHHNYNNSIIINNNNNNKISTAYRFLGVLNNKFYHVDIMEQIVLGDQTAREIRKKWNSSTRLFLCMIQSTPSKDHLSNKTTLLLKPHSKTGFLVLPQDFDPVIRPYHYEDYFPLVPQVVLLARFLLYLLGWDMIR